MFARYFNNYRKIFLLLPLILLFSASAALAQGTAFTFQGKLGDSGTPVSGSFDMQFTLFDGPFDPANPNSSTQIGTTIPMTPVQVTNGIFTVQLDFGEAALPGADRFLEIAIRRNSSDPFTPLLPRSKITSSPYAIRSKNATDADGLSSSCVGCIQSSHISSVDASKLTGTIPSSSLPAGSTNYIQNTMSQQVANFHITGDGALNGSLNVGGTLGIGTNTPATKLDITGTGIIRARINSNSNAGVSLSVANQPKWSLAAVLQGFQIFNDATNQLALSINSLDNSVTATGTLNGNVVNATSQYKLGSNRVFSVFDLSGSNSNTLVGVEAGPQVPTGSSNSFFGRRAGFFTVTGSQNSFFGVGAGMFTTQGAGNSFLGQNAGSTNTTGSNNTAIGINADLGANNLTNATAIGANARVTQSNSLVLGSSGSSIPDTNVGIGTTAPQDRLHVNGLIRVQLLGSSGLSTLCINNLRQISSCSSSLRYKSHIAPFGSGLNLITRLSPITFNWKQGGVKDLGLGAEDVERIEPLLVTYNSKGEVEGVKYDRVAVVLINAVKEQQTQIEALRTSNAALNARLRAIERHLQRRGGSSRRSR